MRVLVWPSDMGGCGKYRLVWPAQALMAQGHDLAIEWGDHAGPRCHWDRPFPADSPPPLEAHVIGCDPVDADVVVLQRPFRRQWAELIPHLQAHGTAVVVDVDDDFTPGVVPLQNAAWRSIDGRHPDHNWHWCREALRLADLVTVSTPNLAKRLPGAEVVRNRIPARYLDQSPVRPHDPPRIGWCGQVATHTGDLEVTEGAVQEVLDQTGAQFHQVGDPAAVQQCLKLRQSPTSARSMPFDKLLRGLTRFDIGIVPLQQSAFNACKSFLKGIEYSAAGLPFVASPTPEYRILHNRGLGILARTPADWHRELLRLVRSPELRAEVGGHNRELVRQHVYDDHADEWWQAWALARVRHHQRAA